VVHLEGAPLPEERVNCEWQIAASLCTTAETLQNQGMLLKILERQEKKPEM